MIVGASTVLVYTIWGGMWAVAITDFNANPQAVLNETGYLEALIRERLADFQKKA